MTLNNSERKQFSELMEENETLKNKLSVATGLQKTLLDNLEIQKVIKVTYRKGLGTNDDPVKIVNSYWDMNGNELFKN